MTFFSHLGTKVSHLHLWPQKLFWRFLHQFPSSRLKHLSLFLSISLSFSLSFFLSFSLSLFLSLNKNGQTPASFSFIFGLFKQNFDFYIKSMWKMSIRYMALGFEPHEHESYPLTTRPGLPPPFSIFSMFLSQNLANLGLFFVYFRFFKLQYNFTANKREKLFIYLDRK